MYYVFLINSFLVGSALGSFINMLIWRLHTGESLLGRSYCDHNKKQLKPIDLIPIFSFLLFKGRCRECNKKIPLLYPLIELLSAVFVSIAFHYSWNRFLIDYPSDHINILLGTIILSSFLLIELFFGYFDYLYWEVEARSVYYSLAYVLILSIINFFIPLPFFSDPIDHILGGIFLASLIGLVYILSNKGGMGEGDIYLFGITGLMLGLKGGYIAFLITVISGSIFGLWKAILNKKIKGTRIQLAPFIALGTIITLLFQQQILSIYFQLFY